MMLLNGKNKETGIANALVYYAEDEMWIIMANQAVAYGLVDME
jgi:hypothetical protein